MSCFFSFLADTCEGSKTLGQNNLVPLCLVNFGVTSWFDGRKLRLGSEVYFGVSLSTLSRLVPSSHEKLASSKLSMLQSAPSSSSTLSSARSGCCSSVGSVFSKVIFSSVKVVVFSSLSNEVVDPSDLWGLGESYRPSFKALALKVFLKIEGL